MILEALEWCLTPASLDARRSGLLSEQIAIRHRARRCRVYWESHLANCRALIEHHCRLAQTTGKPAGQAVILGSGHLNDVDLNGLLRSFEIVTLVDMLHPVEVQLRALLSDDRVMLVTMDVAGVLDIARRGLIPEAIRPPADGLALARQADFVVSLNLLSQLMIAPAFHWRAQGLPEPQIQRLGTEVIRAHLNLLRAAEHALLITDKAARLVASTAIGDWQDLVYGVSLPEPEAEWLWSIADAAERGDGYAEQRQVVAVSLNR
jgi:hypothetical protein